MKLNWFIPIALLIPLRLNATDAAVGARVATITINPKEITVLHLRPEFESTIRMPEEVTSVILGSPGEFKAEHNEGEPEYVYVKPITKQAAQSNLLIATKSGQHVTLELVSDGTGIPNQSQPVDFLIEYRSARSFLISADPGAPAMPAAAGKVTAHESSGRDTGPESSPLSNLDEEFRLQQRVNVPKWTKWQDKQIETSIGDMRQWSNETVISYSVLNSSDLILMGNLLAPFAARAQNLGTSPQFGQAVQGQQATTVEGTVLNIVNWSCNVIAPVIAVACLGIAGWHFKSGRGYMGWGVTGVSLMVISGLGRMAEGYLHRRAAQDHQSVRAERGEV